MSKNLMEVSFTSKMQVEEVEFKEFDHEFLKKEGYTIVKIKDELYGLVKNGHLELKFITFEVVYQDYNQIVYALNLENGIKKLMSMEKVWLGWVKDKVVFSEDFKEIKKVFKEYILVELLSGKRALIHFYRSSILEFIEWENGMCACKNGDSTNHAILELPNGNYTILTKDGLNFNGLEFESVQDYFGEETNDIFRIVNVKKGREALVRISDLKVSKPYYTVDRYSYGNAHYSKKYVKVHQKNSKYCSILRISDFEVSKEYEKLFGIDRDFAVFEKDGKRNILRLSDFKEASWD